MPEGAGLGNQSGLSLFPRAHRPPWPRDLRRDRARPRPVV